MQAGLFRARHRLVLAVLAHPALVTVAPIGGATATARRVRVLVLVVRAGAAVQAGLLLAVRDLHLAIGAREAGLALARVRALARIKADAAVLAWLVIGAVVQVLVAEQAAPALVTDALPRLLARAVHAARIRFAFVAQRPLPAGVATKRKSRKIVKLVIVAFGRLSRCANKSKKFLNICLIYRDRFIFIYMYSNLRLVVALRELP